MVSPILPDVSAGSPFCAIPTGLPRSIPLRMGFSLLAAGDMAFGETGTGDARLRLYRRLGVDGSRVVTRRQVHSLVVDAVRSPGGPFSREGDGFVTDDPSLVLGVTVADCLPVYLYSDDGSCFGVVHSGWKGTGIAVKAVELMERSFGVARPALRAVLGPCIGPCCYDVPRDRAELFGGLFGARSVREHDGRFHLDLAEANVSLLEAAGVRTISVVSACTSCNPLLGSFRREGATSYTRMLALIGNY